MSTLKKQRWATVLEENKQHYTVGNIIYLSYWDSYDYVMCCNSSKGYCEVVVKAVKLVDGQWKVVGAARAHSTAKRNADKIIATGVIL